MNKKTILKTLVIGLLTLLVLSSITPSASSQTKQINIIKTFSMNSWSDNFDSYENGQILDDFSTEDGGWGGWAGSTAAYGTVTNAKSRSNPHSVDIKDASDLVHEYTGYTTGIWVYTAWQYIPTDFSGETYFILLDQYDGGGSGTDWAVQVHFNADTDLVTSDFYGLTTLPVIYGRWVEFRCVIDFDSDWLEIYYDNELLDEHAWTDSIQGSPGSAILNLAAVDLFANSASTVYYDDISLEPYTSSLTCDAGGPYTCELGNPIDFSCAAHGGTSPYTYLWDFGDGETSTDRNPTYIYDVSDLYTVTLTVTDNVQNTAQDTTTANVTVLPPPDLECSGSLTWTKVKAGSTVTGNFTVGNVGDSGSLLNWKVDTYPTWGTWTFTPSSGTGLAAGSSVTIAVSVVAPPDKKKTFTGKIKMINSDNSSDFCEIDVSLTTPRVRTSSFILSILERFPNAFPILRQILSL